MFEHLQVHLVPHQFFRTLLHHVAAGEERSGEFVQALVGGCFGALIVLVGEDVSKLEVVVGEGASFVEADSFELRTLIDFVGGLAVYSLKIEFQQGDPREQEHHSYKANGDCQTHQFEKDQDDHTLPNQTVLQFAEVAKVD